MATIVNTSLITDYSGEPPILTYSNPVTTVIRQTPPVRITTRIFDCQSCGCCNCCCGCQCNGNF
ncbi:MAG: hypothetical protein K2O67_00005 [Clostridia bacterium]|nr:hypothetical protein [Clostridia bacterium]